MREPSLQNKAESSSRLSGIIESILKPLLFASKDNFSHMNSVKGVGPLVVKLCDEALSLGLSGKEALFQSIKADFTGFDHLPEEERKERIGRALTALKVPSFEPHPSRPSLQLPEVKRRIAMMRTPASSLKGVGPKLAGRLEKKGLSTVEEALYYLPFRYEDRSRIKKIRELAPGASEVTTGEVLAMGEARYGRRRVFEMAVGDGSGILKVKWFHFKPSYMTSRYKVGQKLIIYGDVTVFGHQKEMVHPDIELADDDGAVEETGGIVPVYSQIENLHQKTIRKIMAGAVEHYAPLAPGCVPQDILARSGMIDLERAFALAHRPASINEGERARKSLVFDELFMLELGLALKRRQAKKESGIAFSFKGELEGRLERLLPFSLTGAQKRVLEEIGKDMALPHPMNRLIQGDVGSGKTIVSFIAALRAIEAGYQAAIMAPTEILAEQHYLNIHRYAEAIGIRAALLTGNAPKAARTKTLEEIKKGEIDLVAGTHALIQKDVDFHRLGLAVIDEQHRFGVVQRAALKKKGTGSERGVAPDILIMTATPIPRTLSMTVFGDLDVSIIDELPPGRKPVYTKILRESDRMKAYDLIRRELSGGSQCYIVYPLVEESEELSLKDATTMQEHLQRDIFREFKVGLLHGRMKAAEKEEVMRDFKERRLHILVSTTVIEVGVDVPNATVMLVEHAERFGLAQLHQLRGRVGRGEKKSICLLLAAWTNSEDTYKRLKVMEETQDGFKIAEEDLKIRGPGDFLGTRQAGLPDFRTAGTLSDLNLLKRAREEAFRYLEKDPSMTSDESLCLKEVLKARWEGRLELAEIG